MSPELFLTVVIIAGITAALVTALIFAITTLLRTVLFADQPTPIQPQPNLCAQHLWRIASREETAGQPRIVYRCERCQRLEIREV